VKTVSYQCTALEDRVLLLNLTAETDVSLIAVVLVHLSTADVRQIRSSVCHLPSAVLPSPYTASANTHTYWLGGVVVRTLDLRPSRRWFESRS